MQTQIAHKFAHQMKPEKVVTESIVEVHGYVPREKIIKRMIAAGERLEMLTSLGYFDLEFGEDPDQKEVIYDPTRQKSFDMAEAHQLKREILERVQAAIAAGKKPEEVRQEVREEEAKIASQTAPEEPGVEPKKKV